MSDDLVKRLRDVGLAHYERVDPQGIPYFPESVVYLEAADRIEAYQRELAEWIRVGAWQKQRIDALEDALRRIPEIASRALIIPLSEAAQDERRPPKPTLLLDAED